MEQRPSFVSDFKKPHHLQHVNTEELIYSFVPVVPPNYLQFSVSISSFKNYLLCRKYTNPNLRNFFKRIRKKKPSLHPKQ